MSMLLSTPHSSIKHLMAMLLAVSGEACEVQLCVETEHDLNFPRVGLEDILHVIPLTGRVSNSSPPL